MVRKWAEEVIQHELPGYYTPEVEGWTYVITHVGPDTFKVAGCYPQESVARDYLIQVSVTEL